MNYHTATTRVYCSGVVDDGYNGKRTRLGFAFDIGTGYLIAVADFGCFTFDVVKHESEEDALDWLFDCYRVDDIQTYSTRGMMNVPA